VLARNSSASWVIFRRVVNVHPKRDPKRRVRCDPQPFLYAATAVIFFALDFVWLSLSTGPIYRKEIGNLLLAEPNLAIAAGFYSSMCSVCRARLEPGRRQCRQGTMDGRIVRACGLWNLRPHEPCHDTRVHAHSGDHRYVMGHVRYSRECRRRCPDRKPAGKSGISAERARQSSAFHLSCAARRSVVPGS